MRMLAGMGDWGRALGLWLLVVPFLVVQVFAGGVMLARDGGGLAVVICTGEGLVEMVIGPDGEPVEKAHSVACDWGVVGQGAVAVPGGVVPGVEGVAGDVVWLHAAGGLVQRLAVVVPPGRGPPLTV